MSEVTCGGDIRLVCPWWDEPDALRRACNGELQILWPPGGAIMRDFPDKQQSGAHRAVNECEKAPATSGEEGEK